MFTTAAFNAMLDAEGTAYLSLHSAYSATGANELSGGSPAYARKAAVMASASGGSKALSAAVTFDVPGGGTVVAWVGRWAASPGGTFLGMTPLNGQEKPISVDLTANTVKQASHGYANGDQVVFIGGTAPGGLTAGTTYYVVSAATDTYKVAATVGGAAIDLTAEPTGGCMAAKLLPETYASQGTLQVNTSPALMSLLG